ncbi:hypothetical protein KI387_031555, partial [Taxus chinensis]
RRKVGKKNKGSFLCGARIARQEEAQDMEKDEEDSAQKQEVLSSAQEQTTKVVEEEETRDIENLVEDK